MSKTSAASFVADDNYVESPVNGIDVRFHPISVSTMFKLRRVAKPLAKALAVLFAPTDRDTGVVQRAFSEGSETGNETVSEAISPRLAEFRSKERAEALEGLVDALTDPKNAEIVGALIVDSCRGIEFGGESPGAFVGKLRTHVLVQFLKGLMKANTEVLGPLGERVQAVVTQSLDQTTSQETAGQS